MDQSKHDYITIDEIMNDVSRMVDDERFEHASRGYYVSLIQQCLEDLAFETFFDVKEFDGLFPADDLRLELPAGFFNPKEIYVYSGDVCTVNNSRRVYYKRNYSTHGHGYFAQNKGLNPQDPFMPNSYSHRNNIPGFERDMELVRQREGFHTLFYCNVQDGVMMFSPSCRSYPKVHIKYNGTGCAIGEVPFIPLFFRQVTKDFCAEHQLRNRMAKDPQRWKSLWEIYDRNLNRHGDHGDYKGSWYNAAKRVKRMNKFQREALQEYMGRNQF